MPSVTFKAEVRAVTYRESGLMTECLNTLIAVTDHGSRRPKPSRSEQSVQLVAA